MARQRAVGHAAVEGVDGQFALDIDAMIHEAAVEAAPPWQGAPLHFNVDYYPPGDLEAAFAHWQFLNGGHNSYARSRMWHRAIAAPGGAELGEHQFDLFTAELRCEPWHGDHPHTDCACVGDLTYQAICEPCGWHWIAAGENAAVESWHDHALPGWRQLPIVPTRIRIRDDNGRLTKTARDWLAEHYPDELQFPGAPIITERGTGTRHVPGRSPWGGYDLSATATDPDRPVGTAQRPSRRSPSQSVPGRSIPGTPKSAEPLEPHRDRPVARGIGIGD